VKVFNIPREACILLYEKLSTLSVPESRSPTHVPVSRNIRFRLVLDFSVSLGIGMDCGDRCAAGFAAPRERDPARPTLGARTTICLDLSGLWTHLSLM
jgi:hypothetical protein